VLALLTAAATVAAAVAIAMAAGLLGGNDGNAGSIIVHTRILGPDPLAFDPSRSAAYERAAAFGLSHVLFAKSPGGVARTAERTIRFGPLVEKAVAGTGLDPGTVEAMIFLESAGRPDAIAGRDPAAAAGLTQILAETARNLLGMPVNLAASRRLTRRIDAAETAGDTAAVERLQKGRRKVDARFDPAQAIAGAVRYLKLAEGRFGSSSLAVVSYHMGIGNLEGILRTYARRPKGAISAIVRERDLSWARVYFDSSPTRHRKAWLRLVALGDDSQTYYWRVLAAREILRLYRADRPALDRLAQLQGHGQSAEQVLHPLNSTKRLPTPESLVKAWKRHDLRVLPDDPGRMHFRISPRMGALAGRLGGRPALYRGLRPQALRLLVYLARWVHDLSGVATPLTVAQAGYDEKYGRLLAARGSRHAARSAMHTTGYAFDILRRYESGAQAAAFQYALERLETLGLIAWSREPGVIHITVASEAGGLRVSPR
jgi:Transglycosylase SLT domain